MVASESLIFVGAADSRLPNPARPIGEVGSVSAFSSRDGALIWSRAAYPGARPSGMLVGGGKVVTLGSRKIAREVAAFDADSGKPRWQWSPPIETEFEPSFGEHLYDPFASGDRLAYKHDGQGVVQFHDLRSGRLIWSGAFVGLTVSFSGDRMYLTEGDRIDVYRPSSQVFFPQVVVAPGTSTALRLHNSSDAVMEGLLSFLDSDGRPLAVAVQDGPAASEHSFSLAPGEDLRWRTPSNEGLEGGWARAESNTPGKGPSVRPRQRAV